MAITVLKGIPFLRQELTKLFMKKAAEKSGIMTVPFKNKKLQLDIEDRLQKYIRDAKKQGVDLDMVSNENLKYTINLNENVDPISRAISADSSEGKAITDKLFGKKGEVIEGNFGKPFKEQIEDMKKSGDIVDVEDVKISEKITDRDMFKDANQRLKGPIKGKMDMGEFGKVDVETDYSASINRKEFFDPKAKNMYDKTVKTGPEFFKAQKEQILNTINRKKKEMVPTTHSNYKLLKKSLQDQEDALEAIKVTEDLGGNENMFDFLRTQNIADYKAKPLQRSNYTKTDAEIKAEIEAGNKKGIEYLKNKKDYPEGFYTGGMVDVEPNLSDIGHGSDALMARTRLVSPDGQATTSTGLNYLLAEDNDNIRVPFAKGKLAVADAARRKFMKTVGGIGGGIAALKTGLLGFGKEAAPVVQKAVETVSETAQGVPPYFYQLIDVIKSKGREMKSYGERVKQYISPSKDGKSELMLTEDLNTGDIQVKKIYKEGDDMVTKTEEMNFNKGQGDEATKGTSADNYEEVTSYNSRIYKDQFNDPDYVDGIDVESITKEIVEKKADGGRIGFSKVKLATNAFKFLEKIFGKENMAEMPNRDPEMYQGMLEVVDMFRNRDTKGLKKYLQKYLPHMDDAQVEDFIVGDAVDAAGQTKFGLGDMQGQLIRLGSGRDYKAKIEAIKKLEDAQKLDTLDVTEEMLRKPNALGGIQTMLGE